MKQTCPVCQGKGTVHTGFYDTRHCSIKDLMEDKFRNTCRCCDGKGVIETIDPETLEIVRELRKENLMLKKKLENTTKQLNVFFAFSNGIKELHLKTVNEMKMIVEDMIRSDGE